MRKGWWVIAVAGLACSSGTALSTDGAAGPNDTGVVLTPDAATAVPDAIVATDLAVDTARADVPAAVDAASPEAAAPDLPPDIALPPDAAPAVLDVDMNAVFFGPTVAGCESPMAAVVTVSNTGASPSGTLLVAFEGAFADRFRIDKDACSGHALAPAATCVVEVRFAPKQLSSDPITATLAVKGAPGERAEISLSGDASATHFDVFPWSPGSVTFPTTKVGASSEPVEVLWINNTDWPVTVGQPSQVGAAASEYAITSNECTGKTLAAHQSCRVGLRFSPASAAGRLASITLDAKGACGYFFNNGLSLFGVGE